MRRLILWFLFLLFVGNAQAQIRPLSERQRAQQQKYIRHDTLPVRVTPLPTTINTHFSEYAGRLLPDSSFYFTSMRSNVGEDYDHLFETHWDCSIYRSQLHANGTYTAAEMLPAIINTPNAFHANYCFNDDKSQLIYSRCRRMPTGELHCKLWQVKTTHKGRTKPKALPEIINEKGSTTTQPCLVSLPNYQVLYFVSDRKHGIGGLDIWYSICKNGHFEFPINAGSVINTEGNEITPFYDTNRKILYFSSDEHVGIGDYDIFFSEGALSQWGEVTNMGVPFNSEMDDYYLSFNSDGQSGYFSSNRPSPLQSSEDTCCSDLFSFTFLPQDTVPQNPPQDTLTLQEKIASLLPINLYFQNDYPDPKSVSDTTIYDYQFLYEQYLSNLNQYVSGSGSGLRSDSMASVSQAMSDFFRDSVAPGYDKLRQLTAFLTEAVKRGETVRLRVNGYASPLHNNIYNKHLSARRIVSLLNFLRQTNDGFLAPYIDARKTGLSIYRDAQGSVKHDFVSTEIRETVYGLRAAQDRKIVITAN